MSRLSELSDQIGQAIKQLTHAWRGEPDPSTIANLKRIAHELKEMDGVPEPEVAEAPATEGEEQTG